MSGFPVEKQLAAACMAHPYEASTILGVRDEHRPNGIPSAEWLSKQFTFTSQELRAYILDAPTRAKEILQQSLDNRSSPAPYIWDVAGGFHVGWYDGKLGGFSKASFHQRIEDAATDFILMYWGLPRLGGTPISDRDAAAVFATLIDEYKRNTGV